MKIKILKVGTRSKCKLGEVSITDHEGEGSECEHCGKMPPFTAVISDGYTHYCLDCTSANDYDEDMTINDDDKKLILDECKQREKDYIEKRYKELFK